MKPARGEQGWGVTVGAHAGGTSGGAAGADVLAYRAPRGAPNRCRPPSRGDRRRGRGRRPSSRHGHRRRELDRGRAHRRGRPVRRAETEGSARIPLDDSVARMVRGAGWELHSVLPPDTEIVVSPTANVHNGATIEDVTGQLHPDLAETAVAPPRASGCRWPGLISSSTPTRSPMGPSSRSTSSPGWPTMIRIRPRPDSWTFSSLRPPTLPCLAQDANRSLGKKAETTQLGGSTTSLMRRSTATEHNA